MTSGGSLRKRSVVVAGHATSITLEDLFWELLKRQAGQRGLSVNDLVTEIDANRDGNLSSAIRIFVTEKLIGRASKTTF